MNKELEKIKKLYGEQFCHLCRTLFPTILEKHGALLFVLTNKFAPSHSLYDDIINQQMLDTFRTIIFNTYYQIVKPLKLESTSTKTAEELMDEKGYILYPECKTEADIQAFKKYYKTDEELCTFKGDRLKTSRVWFAVKKNADQIKREDFTSPERQDEYGTSVISIQFTKGPSSYISIKNRYNHTVRNPDSTFGNNLDNLAVGLTDAFTREYNIRLLNGRNSEAITIPNYVMAENGVYYRYNSNFNTIFYCENNVVIDGQSELIMQYDGCQQMLIDNYVLDLKNKTLTNYDVTDTDSFPDTIGKIKKIDVKRTVGNAKVITITPERGENIIITVDSRNSIIGYKNHNVHKIGQDFMRLNQTLQKIDMPNVTKIGFGCLRLNTSLTSLKLESLKVVYGEFLSENKNLKYIMLPKLKKKPNNFFEMHTDALIYAPKCGFKNSLFEQEDSSLDM